MNDSVSCQFREAVPTVEDYCQLRVLAGLSAKSQEAAARALPNTLYGVCAYQGNELVAMGRIVGDGGCHLQVCDIAVLPRLQGQGLGKEVMRRWMAGCRRTCRRLHTSAFWPMVKRTGCTRSLVSHPPHLHRSGCIAGSEVCSG